MERHANPMHVAMDCGLAEAAEAENETRNAHLVLGPDPPMTRQPSDHAEADHRDPLRRRGTGHSACTVLSLPEWGHRTKPHLNLTNCVGYVHHS